MNSNILTPNQYVNLITIAMVCQGFCSHYSHAIR